MQVPAGQMTTPSLQSLLKDGALAGEWVLDPRRSSIRLKNPSLGGLIPVTGVFQEVSAHGTIAPDGQVSGTLTVAAASVDTKNRRRDRHLRSSSFFDTDNHPELTFAADGIRPSGEGVAVTGKLTVLGQTRLMSFDAAASVQREGEISLDAVVHINRADFGMTWNVLGLASMHNTLTIHAVFTRR